jgi:hypothetical protein
MTEAFNLSLAHHCQDDALASQARLRSKGFIQQRGLHHYHFDGLEYDELDNVPRYNSYGVKFALYAGLASVSKRINRTC